MFSGCTLLPDSKETELESSYQEASPSAGKNTGVVLVPCRTWNCVPTATSGGADISEVSGCFVTTDEFLVRVTKVKDLCLINSRPSFLILTSLTLWNGHTIKKVHKKIISNVHHKNRLTFSVGTDRPGKVISNNLTQMVHFPAWIPDYDSPSPALLDYFSVLTLVFVLQWC